MCEWLEISKSGYYDWRSRPQSAAAKRHELLKIKVKALFDANNGEYDYRRVHAALVRGGEQVDDETVRGIMRELGLEPCQPKPRCRSLTEQDGQASPIPDLVNRDFSASKPGLKMVGDITYIPTLHPRPLPGPGGERARRGPDPAVDQVMGIADIAGIAAKQQAGMPDCIGLPWLRTAAASGPGPSLKRHRLTRELAGMRADPGASDEMYPAQR